MYRNLGNLKQEKNMLNSRLGWEGCRKKLVRKSEIVQKYLDTLSIIK